MQFVRSMEITTSAAPSAVWDLVSDIRQHPQWAANNLAVAHLSGPEVGEGARYSSTVAEAETWSKLATTGLIEVVESHPKHLFIYECADEGGRYRWLFEVTAWNGETLVSHTMERLSAPLRVQATQPLLWSLTGGKQMHSGLIRLKELAERATITVPDPTTVSLDLPVEIPAQRAPLDQPTRARSD